MENMLLSFALYVSVSCLGKKIKGCLLFNFLLEVIFFQTLDYLFFLNFFMTYNNFFAE